MFQRRHCQRCNFTIRTIAVTALCSFSLLQRCAHRCLTAVTFLGRREERKEGRKEGRERGKKERKEERKKEKKERKKGKRKKERKKERDSRLQAVAQFQQIEENKGRRSIFNDARRHAMDMPLDLELGEEKPTLSMKTTEGRTYTASDPAGAKKVIA